ncbi:MAG TPA: hypothetical protein PK467_06340 [Candidatus Wallbacteria bacterium]|nr:hypothetical protein [Candidatus Wallbacteria bacterium]
MKKPVRLNFKPEFFVFIFFFALFDLNFAAAQTTLEVAFQTMEVRVKPAESTLEIALMPFDDRPNSAEIEFNSALGYINKQEYTTAIELLKRSADFDPGFAKAYYNMGLCLYRLGMNYNASEQFGYAIDKNPNYIDAYHNNIVILSKIGKNKEAAALAEIATGLCNKLKLYERAETYKKILESLKTRYKEERKTERKKKYGEKETAEILKKMRTETDDVADMTRYTDKSTTAYNNVESFHLTLIKPKELEKPLLYLKIQRRGSEYLGIQSYTIKADENKFEITLGWNDLKSDFNYGAASENYTMHVNNSNIDMIKSLAGAKKIIIRYHGRQFYDDRTVSAKEIKALNNVLEAYEALGGDFEDMDLN